MRRVAASLLLITFLAMGTGLLAHLHELDHQRQDAHQAPQPAHDESNCLIHALLHVPMLATPTLALLVCLGLFVAFLTLLDTPLVSQRDISRIDCRGPPAC